MSDGKSMASHSSDALRALISAAGLVGAISLIYTWSAPWLVFLVDNWREFSDWAFGWVWFETTPGGRLGATAAFTFAGAQFAGLFRSRHSLSMKVWLPMGSFLTSVSVLLSREDGGFVYVALVSVMLVVLYYFTLAFNRAFGIWLAVWLGLAFAIERVYRWGILDNIPTPG